MSRSVRREKVTRLTAKLVSLRSGNFVHDALLENLNLI